METDPEAGDVTPDQAPYHRRDAADGKQGTRQRRSNSAGDRGLDIEGRHRARPHHGEQAGD